MRDLWRDIRKDTLNFLSLLILLAILVGLLFLWDGSVR